VKYQRKKDKLYKEYIKNKNDNTENKYLQQRNFYFRQVLLAK